MANGWNKKFITKKTKRRQKKQRTWIMRFLIVSCQQGSLVRSWVLKLMNIKSIASIIYDMSFFRVFCLQGFVSTKYEFISNETHFSKIVTESVTGLRYQSFMFCFQLVNTFSESTVAVYKWWWSFPLSKRWQIRWKLWICSDLLVKSVSKNFMYRAV